MSEDFFNDTIALEIAHDLIAIPELTPKAGLEERGLYPDPERFEAINAMRELIELHQFSDADALAWAAGGDPPTREWWVLEARRAPAGSMRREEIEAWLREGD